MATTSLSDGILCGNIITVANCWCVWCDEWESCYIYMALWDLSVGIDFPVLVALRPRPAQLSSEREQWPGRPSSEHRPPTPGDTTQPDCLHHIHCPGHPATTTLTTTTTTTTLPHGGRNWQCFLQSSSPRLSSSFSHSYRIILWGEGGGGGQVNWFGETTHHQI